jgi:hypothetical protein
VQNYPTVNPSRRRGAYEMRTHWIEAFFARFTATGTMFPEPTNFAHMGEAPSNEVAF